MEVEVYYLFSRNKSLGSRLIAWASGSLVKDLDKVPSHMAVLLIIKEAKVSLVLESVFDAGVRIVPYSKWLEINEECYKIACPQNRDLSEIVNFVNTYWGRKYDWPGVMYFAWRFFLKWLLKKPFPDTNKWQSEERYFCNELGGEIAGYSRYSMVTPAKMCSDFLRNNLD